MSSSLTGKNFLSMVDTPVFTEYENVDSRLREELQKTMTLMKTLVAKAT